jgi:hypothetical protein
MLRRSLKFFKKTIVTGITGGLAIMLLNQQVVLDSTSDIIEKFTLQSVKNPHTSKSLEEEKKFIKSLVIIYIMRIIQ